MQKFYGISDLVTLTSFGPLILCDVSRQSERIQRAIIDMTIQCYFSANVPAKTKAYCLMISDKRLEFKSDGSKANLLY